MKTLTSAVLALLLANGWTCALPQTKIELKLSHFSPSTHGIHTDFIEPWARELEQRTKGRVQIKIFDGASRLGNPARQLEQVLAGAVDIAHGMQGASPGRFPRTEIIEMPFLTENADVATRILWTMYPKQFKEEYAGVKVLALHAHNGGLIHTRDKKVARMQDLKGLRLRSPSTAINKMLSLLGATPVGMPPGQVFINLKGGLIDGALFPWDGARAYRIDEVAKYHLDARAYTLPYYFVMNRRKYQALPAEVRKAIDETSGDALIAHFAAWWNKWDQAGVEMAKKRGNLVTPLNAAERERWAGAVLPATDKFLGEVEKLGVKDAREIYAQMKKLNKQLSTPPAPR